MAAGVLFRRPKFALDLGRVILNNIRNNEKNIAPSIMPIRNYWNKDWQPGPYPRTEAEQIAAAKKYNLIPEDYKPFPEEMQMGDYPDLPLVPTDLKDPNEPWDFQLLRKNYGEPLHHMVDYYGEDRLNPISPLKYSYPVQILAFLGFVLTFAALGIFSNNIKLVPPVLLLGVKFKNGMNCVLQLPKQMPEEGLKHYTFELSQ